MSEQLLYHGHPLRQLMGSTTVASEPGTTRSLAEFAAGLCYEKLPEPVITRTVELFLDWLGSSLAGRHSRPVNVLGDLADNMGPATGDAEILPLGRSSSPYFAAMINAASSHVVEQDDLHNGSVLHPATVVFPAALALAQSEGISGRRFITAAVAGYEIGIRVGEFLGRSHYRVFHTTGTAGTLAAAAAAGSALALSPAQMTHNLGSAGTSAAGLWEFLRDGADSKQLHTANAAATGVLSAWTAARGLTAAERILEGAQGMAAGMSSDADPDCLADGLGERWAVLETSLKFHASCRHTHPAAEALLLAMVNHGLNPSDVSKVRAQVHQAALDVLGPVQDPANVHQAKFSMGRVLGLIACRGRAGVSEFEQHYQDPDVVAFGKRVEMVLDAEVDRAYPRQWIGKIRLLTRDGRRVDARVDEARGDPGNPLSPDDIEHKFKELAGYSRLLDETGALRVIEQVKDLAGIESMGFLLPRKVGDA
jgi:2-methylcitrate dehydratase PrpD